MVTRWQGKTAREKWGSKLGMVMAESTCIPGEAFQVGLCRSFLAQEEYVSIIDHLCGAPDLALAAPLWYLGKFSTEECHYFAGGKASGFVRR